MDREGCGVGPERATVVSEANEDYDNASYDEGYRHGYAYGEIDMENELRDKIEGLAVQLSIHLGPGYEISMGFDLTKLIAAVPDRLRDERERGFQDGIDQATEGANDGW